MPVTLSLVGVSIWTKAAASLPASWLAVTRHLVERRDEAIDLAVDLGTFAERVDVGIVAAHAGIDDDAPVNGDAGLFGQRRIRPDADGHHHKRCWDNGAVSKFHLPDLAVAGDRLGVGLGDDLDAALLHRTLQEIAGGRIELALHQGRHDMQHGDVHALRVEARRRFQTQQAAADDHRLRPRLGSEHHRLHVIEIAIGQHPGRSWPGTGMMNGTEPVAMTSLS